MEINLNNFLAAFSQDKTAVKKIAAKAVIDFRKTRSVTQWNENLEKIIQLGVCRQRLKSYFMTED